MHLFPPRMAGTIISSNDVNAEITAINGSELSLFYGPYSGTCLEENSFCSRRCVQLYIFHVIRYQ